MRYLIEPKNSISVKGCGFLSFAKSIGKNLSNKYSQKLLDTARKSTTDALKTASKRGIQKTAEATGDLVGKKIADKITSVSKKSNKELPNNDETEDVEITAHKKRSVSPEERQQIIDELRLIPKNQNCMVLKKRQQIIFNKFKYNIKMEYQKIIHLLDNAPNKPSKF